MNIWNQYFKIEIYKEKADTHSGKQKGKLTGAVRTWLWNPQAATEHEHWVLLGTARAGEPHSKSWALWTQQNQKPETYIVYHNLSLVCKLLP